MNGKKLLVLMTVMLVAVFITACGNPPEQNDQTDKGKITDEKEKGVDDSKDGHDNIQKKQKEKDANLDESGKKTDRNTEDIIEKPEYNSFEEFVSSEAKDFNGKSEMWDVYADEDELKLHLVTTSGLYLKHFKALDEIPAELQSLTNDAIELSSPFEDMFTEYNLDEVNESFNRLKNIYEQMEKEI